MDGETKLAAAMAMAGRVARACDVCGKERARWYCAADEAYLCEHCDGNVHNANPLSRRHERVRLAPNGAPMKIDRRSADASTRCRKVEQPQPPDTDSPAAAAAPTAPAPGTSTRHHRHGTWQRGYSKKRSRSGRRRTHSLAHLADAAPPAAPLFTDPDRKNVKQEPGSPAHADSQAAHEVPTFLPDDYLELPVVSMSNDICFNDVHPLSWLDADDTSAATDALDFLVPDGNQQGQGFDDTPECLHSELDAGMDALMDDGTLMLNEISGTSMTGIGNLGILDLCTDRDDLTLDFSDIGALNCASTEAETPAGNIVPAASPFRLFARLKTEFAEYDHHRKYEQRHGQEQQHGFEQHDHEQQQGQIQQYEQQEPHHFDGDKQVPAVELGDILGCSLDELEMDEKWSGPSLKLNYEDVLNAWSERGMSWSDSRCQAVPADSNPDSTVSSDVGIVPDLGSSVHQCSEAAMGGADDGCTGGGREARVMRYREKRRTRLFSKKIRYEVRKLNAERRPRMKGRFVKRTGL